MGTLRSRVLSPKGKPRCGCYVLFGELCNRQSRSKKHERSLEPRIDGAASKANYLRGRIRCAVRGVDIANVGFSRSLIIESHIVTSGRVELVVS